MEHRSFEQIYLQYYKPVYAYLMTLCQNEELAAELTQETFYKALDAIDGFKGGCALNVWLCQIAKKHPDGYIPAAEAGTAPRWTTL